MTPGTRLGAYEALSLLGAGGMGEVYRAEDTRLKRKIAIKLLRLQLTRDADRVRRFEQEARALYESSNPALTVRSRIGLESVCTLIGARKTGPP